MISAIKREKVQVLVAVPRVLESLKSRVTPTLWLRDKGGAAQTVKEEKIWKRWWRYRDIHRQFGWKFWAFISGGATLDVATEEFWRKIGLAVISGIWADGDYVAHQRESSVQAQSRLDRKSAAGTRHKSSEDGEILIPRGGCGYWILEAGSGVAGCRQ